jgi:hypothetical protein
MPVYYGNKHGVIFQISLSYLQFTIMYLNLLSDNSFCSRCTTTMPLCVFVDGQLWASRMQ